MHGPVTEDLWGKIGPQGTGPFHKSSRYSFSGLTYVVLAAVLVQW